MQPTLPQAAGTADMDLTAVQSINDWFFKKEQIYLLAQFWQQVSDGPPLPHSHTSIAQQSIENNRTTNRAFDQSTNQRESREKKEPKRNELKNFAGLLFFFFLSCSENCVPQIVCSFELFSKEIERTAMEMKFLELEEFSKCKIVIDRTGNNTIIKCIIVYCYCFTIVIKCIDN